MPVDTLSVGEDCSIAEISRLLDRARRPILLRGALAGSTALEHWTPEYLAAALGERSVPVEYSLRPIFHPRPHLNGGRYFRKPMTIAGAIDRIRDQPNRKTWTYLSSLPLEAVAPYQVAELPPPDRFSRRAAKHLGLFLGNDSSGTHFHYDTTDNLVAIFRGGKRVRLASPQEGRKLRPYASWHRCGHFSSLKPAAVAASEIATLECLVEPGDALYLPCGWWHQVVNVGLTVGVSYIWEPFPRERLRWDYLRVRVVSRAASTIRDKQESSKR